MAQLSQIKQGISECLSSLSDTPAAIPNEVTGEAVTRSMGNHEGADTLLHTRVGPQHCRASAAQG